MREPPDRLTERVFQMLAAASPLTDTELRSDYALALQRLIQQETEVT